MIFRFSLSITTIRKQLGLIRVVVDPQPCLCSLMCLIGDMRTTWVRCQKVGKNGFIQTVEFSSLIIIRDKLNGKIQGFRTRRLRVPRSLTTGITSVNTNILNSSSRNQAMFPTSLKSKCADLRFLKILIGKKKMSFNFRA